MPPSSMLTVDFENVTVGVSSPLRMVTVAGAEDLVCRRRLPTFLRFGAPVHER